jgi:regulator of CtrA degradation
MRVTTRLMQAAGWRSFSARCRRRHDGRRRRLRPLPFGSSRNLHGQPRDGVDALPKKLLELLERSESLYRRVARLDDVLFRQGNTVATGANSHLAILQAAFGGERK